MVGNRPRLVSLVQEDHAWRSTGTFGQRNHVISGAQWLRFPSAAEASQPPCLGSTLAQLHTNKVGPGTTTTSIHCDASTSKAQTLSCRCFVDLGVLFPVCTGHAAARTPCPDPRARLEARDLYDPRVPEGPAFRSQTSLEFKREGRRRRGGMGASECMGWLCLCFFDANIW